MLGAILLAALTAFLAAYVFYGRFLEKRFGLDDSRPTPSHSEYDGVDRVPASRAVLLGHHFSSIAGAGPIVGPIIAAAAFGWAPALVWIVFGTIFIGGVHDFAALVASIRHRARSIAEIAREYMSPTAYRLFLAFIWLALVYVLAVFADLTGGTFENNGGVATSSILFMLLALGFGLLIYRLKVRVLWSSLVFVPLVFAGVWLGQQIPIRPETIPVIGATPAKTWSLILLVYCFVASTTPVWILLQPRDYLSSFLLYASVFAGVAGLVFGGFPVQYPAFHAWYADGLGPVFPILFITVACGACSGFHAIVGSGTSSKQLDKEKDARIVGYGSMLIEGLVAVIAVAAVIMLAGGDPQVKATPMQVFAAGMSEFCGVLGVPKNIGFAFGLLAVSTFMLTTLDTATRLARYVFEEFFALKGALARYVSTAATLVLPAIFVLVTLKDAQGKTMPAWKAIWPVFGATNQLLAGLALLVIAVWLKKTGRKTLFVLLPMAFMIAVTTVALVLLIAQYRLSAIGIIAAVLFLLALLLIWEAALALRRPASPAR